jgi:hypothetical protein
MKRKIYIQDWLDLKPYSKQCPTDKYYLQITNQVYKALLDNKFSAVFLIYLDEEEIKSLSCFLVSYFEDIVSGTNLFVSFVKKHEELYGKKLPFFDQKDYFEDEANEADVAFLIWYFLNTIQHNKFISPANSFLFELAGAAMAIFDEEFEYAPENEVLKKVYVLSNDADYYIVRGLMEQILFESYLFYPDARLRFFEALFELSANEEIPKKNMPQIVNALRDEKTLTMNTRLLNLKGKDWAALVAGEKHPLYNDILSISNKIFSYFFYKGQDSQNIFLEHLATGKKFNMTKKSFDHSSELKHIDTILMIGLVQWKNEWWFSGIFSSFDFDADLVLEERSSIKSRQTVSFLDEKSHDVLGMLDGQYQDFLKFNNGSPIAYMPIREVNGFIKKATEHYNDSLNLSKKEKEESKKRMAKEGFAGSLELEEPDYSEFENDAVVFFNPKSGIEIGFGICGAFPVKENPFFEEKDSNGDTLFLLMNEDFSTELALYSIDNFKDKLLLFTEGDGKMYLEDMDFLLRFWKVANYQTKPQVTAI